MPVAYGVLSEWCQIRADYISNLFVYVQKLLNQSEARKQQEFSGAWPKGILKARLKFSSIDTTAKWCGCYG